jgi:hypothetical protein
VKIKREEAQPSRNLNERLTSSIYFQISFLLLAFLAGAVIYRSGIIRPATLLIRQIITGKSYGVEMPAPVVEVKKNIQDEIRLYQNNGLPTLYIDLKFKNYQKLLAKRDEALKIGVLQTTDEDFVPATVHLQDGPELDAKMRLKGDWTDHLQGDKWSFRIHLKEDGQILNFRQFSIQTPVARTFLDEWAFHRNLEQEGILTPRYDFINVLLNGKLLGVYAIEENFATEMIEGQGRRQGVIIRFNEDTFWNNIANYWGEGIQADGGTWMVTNEDSADITPFQVNKINSDPNLTAEAQTARDLLRAFQTGERPASEVFDVNLMGRFLALSDLWNACHGVTWHNLRFYFNPVTGLLEPVAYDSEPFRWCEGNTSNAQRFIDNGLFNDPEIRTAYARELKRITQTGYLETFQNTLGDEPQKLGAALEVEFPDDEVGVSWSKLSERQKSLALELQPAQPVRGSYQALGVTEGDSTASPELQVDLTNLMILPVELLGFEINDVVVMPSEAQRVLSPVMDPKTDSFIPNRFTVPIHDRSLWNGDELPQVKAVVRLQGQTDEFKVLLEGATTPEGLMIGPLPQTPTIDEVLKQHPFLSLSPDGQILLASEGIWNVSGDLIVPEGVTLQVAPGTVLKFEPGAILLTRGAVNLGGAPDAPVILTAQQDLWGGIIVLNSPKESLWKYAAVEQTGGISRNGWILTGGITLYQSDIRLENVFLGNNQTEDAINVVHGNFNFIDSEFANTLADAFDSDFSKGEVSGCYFHDIAGDAVDVSGTTATIKDSKMERITDKGVSVGEKSTIIIQNIQMDIVGIGAASKDLSKTYVYTTTISHARYAALAAYIKKPVYGPAYLEAPDVVITDTPTEAVAQTGSTILLHGEEVPTVEMDVDKLYKEGILGN